MATNFYFGIIGAPVYQPSEIYEHMQSNQTKVDRSIVHLINTVQRYCFFVAFKQIITMMMMMMTMMMMMIKKKNIHQSKTLNNKTLHSLLLRSTEMQNWKTAVFMRMVGTSLELFPGPAFSPLLFSSSWIFGNRLQSDAKSQFSVISTDSTVDETKQL